MVEFKIGIIIAFIGLLILFLAFMNNEILLIEKVLIMLFCSLLIVFGVLIEKGFFSYLKEEFDQERKF